ncbi:hypothetical protein EV177_008479 [Coemansia sp. RSA 1804]|nr:hypothetical protein EV177_008479 [Coemansia sp. RSA 1804]
MAVATEAAAAAAAAIQQPENNSTVDVLLQADSPVIAYFDDQPDNYPEASLATTQEATESTLPTQIQTYRPTARLQRKNTQNAVSPSSTVSSDASVVTGTQPNRYGSVRLRERPANTATGVANRLRDRSSMFSSSFSPIQPEVANMLSQINEHRKETAVLAENTGVMSDKYYQCLQGYTSIQEPTSAFWKRRYFVVAENTMFLYTNECSRVPTDYLEIGTIVRSPRDAEDEVLMPHSLAVDFGSGDYYMYFDTLDMMRAFQGEISKSIEAA